MTKLVKCPACNGRGMIGYSTKTKDGVAFFDFECDFCKGRGWVSKRRADKYEQENKDGLLCGKETNPGIERKGTTAGMEKHLKEQERKHVKQGKQTEVQQGH